MELMECVRELTSLTGNKRDERGDAEDDGEAHVDDWWC